MSKIFFGICIFLQIYSHVFGESCMSLSQLNTAIGIMCHQQRHNQTLWQKVIDCHEPIPEEFMRGSGKALCPNPKYVEDPSDTKYSIQEVFYNICGFIDGNFFQKLLTGICFVCGSSKIMSHNAEVAAVEKMWGADLPCKIGKCILDLDIKV